MRKTTLILAIAEAVAQEVSSYMDYDHRFKVYYFPGSNVLRLQYWDMDTDTLEDEWDYSLGGSQYRISDMPPMNGEKRAFVRAYNHMAEQTLAAWDYAENIIEREVAGHE